MEVIEKDLENYILEISLNQVGNKINILVHLYSSFYSILLTELGGPSPKKKHLESQRMESKGQGIE